MAQNTAAQITRDRHARNGEPLHADIRRIDGDTDAGGWPWPAG